MLMIRLLIITVVLFFPAIATAQEPIDYLRDVKPIFAKFCVDCHGPAKQRGGLRLDTASAILKGNDAGTILTPKKAASSSLYLAITHAKDISAMPPEGRPQPTKAEVALIKKWIDMGAPAPKDEAVTATVQTKSDHWAFQPIQRAPLPTVKKEAWVRNPIDRFILAKLEHEKLMPAGEADRVTLLRRVSLDLLGLPPTPAEVDAFVNDTAPDAYEKHVDRLLKSPHYGERWARHWLDLARYADSNGFTIDGPRTMWPYRDWVINALNRDEPMDQFIIDQLAGDMLPGATQEQKVATGFHRNTLTNQEGGIDLEMFRVESIIDRVNTTGAAFLGLTVGCAQCHDHKYDPISQGEFYRLFAFLNNCDEPTLALPTALEQKSLASNKQKIAQVEKALAGFDTTSPAKQKAWEDSLSVDEKLKLAATAPKIRDIIDKADNQRTKKDNEDLRTFLRQADQIPQLLANLGDALPGGVTSAGTFGVHAHLLHYRQSLEARLVELKKAKPDPHTTLVVQERAKKPRDTYFLIKGDYMRKGNKMQAGTPAVLPPLKTTGQPNRLDFARWIVDPVNPLTSRVLMNRVWQQYFGVGIVETENDFGLQGTPPSHPELLDWLASELIEQKWSLKAMHRLIVTSATYRQSSKYRPELANADPRNRLLARQTRLRLEAEVVRDVALAAGGLLNPKVGGPSVFPPQPAGVFAFTQTQRDWKADAGADRYRRGLYTYFWRSAPHPGLTAFDAPDSNTTCTRRNRSNTPLQALTLLNDKAFFEFSQGLASRVLKSPGDDAAQVTQAFRLCLAREPSPAERDRLQTLLSQLQQELAANPKETQRLVPANLPPGVTPTRAAAWALVSRALLNLDEFITRE